jgi:hypothetical protein
MRELEEGLRILAAAGQADAARLAEMHGAQRRFEEICDDIIALEATDSPGPHAPGVGLWLDMVRCSGEVVGPSQELQTWREIGDAVGHSQYELGSPRGLEINFIPEAVGTLPKLLRQLGLAAKPKVGDVVAAALREITKPPKWTVRQTGLDRSIERYWEVWRLDRRLRAALGSEKAPEPRLVLTRQEIRFYGEARRVADYPPTEMALLRVLAARSGSPIPTEEIIKRGKLRTDVINLKYAVSRLEKILEELYLAACRRRGESPAPGEVPDFIIAGRGRGGPGTGTYKLNLDLGQVRVDLAGPP